MIQKKSLYCTVHAWVHAVTYRTDQQQPKHAMFQSYILCMCILYNYKENSYQHHYAANQLSSLLKLTYSPAHFMFYCCNNSITTFTSLIIKREVMK